MFAFPYVHKGQLITEYGVSFGGCTGDVGSLLSDIRKFYAGTNVISNATLANAAWKQSCASTGRSVMILAKEATRVEIENDPANVVDLVQVAVMKFIRDSRVIAKPSFSLIAYV
jgi:hypothetical protein